MRTADDRVADVRAILEAAARVRDARASFAKNLSTATGLSPAGIDLALDEHLEVDAPDHDLRALVAGAGSAPQVAVLLSSNVFVGGLRAIAIARASSEKVIVRPSAREPVFARALVGAIDDARVVLDEALDVADVERGEVHVYGRDKTIADIRAVARQGVRVRGHGAGMGVAYASDRAIDDAATAIARDVVVFDQRGCLSPRIVLADASVAERLADALHAALTEREARVPRGILFEADEARRWMETMSFAGRVRRTKDHAVAVGANVTVPPPGRHVLVVACKTRDEARAKIAPLARWIVAFGSDDEDAARDLAPPHARISALGRMQRPPLDGPVDRRDDSA